MKFTELLALQLKPANFKTQKRIRVSAPKWGTACVFCDGPCRASVAHDVAVPLIFAHFYKVPYEQKMLIQHEKNYEKLHIFC